MKKCVLTIMLLIVLCSTGCDIDAKGNTYQLQEQPHLYLKDIDVIVMDIDKKHWFATTHWYVVDITVKSKEYGLTESFKIEGSGAFGCPKEWNYEEGQTVRAELYSWVMDSTGKVTKRKINKVY